jgi:RHS repeat-associated protein
LPVIGGLTVIRLTIAANIRFMTLSARAGALILLLLIFAPCLRAQQDAGATTPSVAPGAPAGSYALSGFENVNLYNGNLNFRLPLMQVGGRGAAGYTMMLPIETRWQIIKGIGEIFPGDYYASYTPITNSWYFGDKPGYGPGKLMGRFASYFPQGCDPTFGTPGLALLRLTFVAPDGTEYELRDQLRDGEPYTVACPNPYGGNRGNVFKSADGTAVTFVSDTNITDTPNDPNLYPSGRLMMRDGTRFRIDSGNVTWIQDRNGNKVSFTYDSQQRVTTITDSLNRQLTISYYNPPSQAYDSITWKGYNNTQREIRVYYAALSTVLRGDFSPGTMIFPPAADPAADPWNPNGYNFDTTTVVSQVLLPNNQSYYFKYNPHLELAEVTLPTGGKYQYDWDAGPGTFPGAEGMDGEWGVPPLWPTPDPSYTGAMYAYRRVTQRRVLPDGSTPESIETYNVGGNSSGVIITVNHLDAGRNLQAQDKHYFYGGPFGAFNAPPTSYAPWNEAREYQTEAYDTGGNLLRRVTNTWQQRAAVSWWPPGYPDSEPPNDPRIVETVTTLADANQVAKQTFSYDSYNNQTDIREYDFGPGAPPAYPTRHTHTDYLTSGYDTNTNIHLRNLPSQQLVYAVNPSTGAETQASHITFEYDLYDGSANHALLVDRPGISGLDSGFTTGYTTRGNVTKVSRWLDTPSSWIDTFVQYDIAGNVVKVIDGRGYATDFEFIDRYGSANGEARANTAPPELGGQTSYAFPTKVTDSLGQTVYTQYDYYLGRPVDGEDHNGMVSSGFYNDALDRQTQIIRANTASPTDPNRSQTTFTYNDASHLITTTRDRDAFGDNWIKSEIVYDGLGRTVEARTYAPGPAGCSSPCYSLVKSTFDSMGRTYQVSNPYWNHESPIWTTTQYDALDRVVSMTTPDGATVSTAYNGAQVTVTDQAGKKRRSKTDALGRLTMVTEDPGGLNYDTVYLYDALGNLRKVTQGAQTRWFATDSLSRLIRAKNPEQADNTSPNMSYTDPVTGHNGWAMAFSYDKNGNLESRIDARNITTTIIYDTINRPTSKSYTDGTPVVKYYYDAQELPAGAPSFDRGKSTGRLVAVTYGGGSQGNYNGYDSLGRVLRKFQQTGATNYQTQATYNKAGAVTGETYPSGRTVNYTYRQDGRVSSFSGNLGGSSSIYADTIGYNAAGQMIKERFGTNTSLYHNQHYNCRLQPADIRLGDSATDEWTWSRGAIGFKYGTTAVATGNDFAYDTDNNGNLRRQNYYVPLAGGGYVISQIDDYYYDALNRIAAVREQQQDANGQTADSVSQAYSYDRQGNRTLDLSGGGSGAVVWVDNALPSGATVGSDGGDGWTWVSSNPSPYSGTVSHQSNIAAGEHQHYFYGATQTLQVNPGDRLYAYVYLDPVNTPSEVMLQWNDGSGWEHRAYWGANNLGWGANETASRRYMGPLPATGGWVRLEVPASAVGLEGKTVNGMAFTLCDGRATWDKAGKDNLFAGVTSSPINNNVYTVDAGSNRLTSVNGVTMFYDAAGNQTDDGSGQRIYDAENRMLTATNGGVSSSYTYDADGSRVKRIIGGVETWQVYGIGGELLAEYAAGAAPSAPQKEYGYRGGQLLVVWDGSETGDKQLQWLVQDYLGSTRMVVDRSGSLGGIRRRDFGPFGEELSAGVGIRSAALGYGGDLVRQKYTGYEHDDETRLDFAQARYYSNIQGRFTSADSLLRSAFTFEPQSWNRYAYVGNRPLYYVDPSGLIWGVNKERDQVRWFDGDNIPVEYVKEGWAEIKANSDGKYIQEIKGITYELNPAGPNEKADKNDSWAHAGARIIESMTITETVDPSHPDGQVLLCSRPALSFGIAINSHILHKWLKTPNKEAGIGPKFGPLTKITDQTGQADRLESSCVVVPEADVKRVDSQLKIGRFTGVWLPVINDCQSFAYMVLHYGQFGHYPPMSSSTPFPNADREFH